VFSIFEHDKLRSLLPIGSFGTILHGRIRKAWYKSFADNPFAVAEMPALLHEHLHASCRLLGLQQQSRFDSTDRTTTRLLLTTIDRQPIETVIMRYPHGRCSVCISSQTGCNMGCTFCATASLGSARNLEAWEMLEQVHRAHKVLQTENRQLGNVVIMGMGEPFLNYQALDQSLQALTDPGRFQLAARKITVSSCGIVPVMERFTTHWPEVSLAVSLHSTDQASRDRLMPGVKHWPLEVLWPAIRTWSQVTGRRIMLEYLLIAGVNDREADARQLIADCQSISPLPHVNLMAYNPPVSAITSRQSTEIDKFHETLRAAGLPATVRRSMGEDIAGACGQLAARNLHRETASARDISV